MEKSKLCDIMNEPKSSRACLTYQHLVLATRVNKDFCSVNTSIICSFPYQTWHDIIPGYPITSSTVDLSWDQVVLISDQVS